MTVSYGKGARGKATVLHSKIVRSRGACENCGKTYQLECAHIVGRTLSWTRTDEANAYCLCSQCHARFTAWPVEFAEFIDRTIGREAYDALRAKAESGVRRKFDWDAELARLTERWAQVQRNQPQEAS